MKKIFLSTLLTSLLSFSNMSYASDVECKIEGYGFDISRIVITEKASSDGVRPPHMRILGEEYFPGCATSGCAWRPSPDSKLLFYIPLDKSKHLPKAIFMAIKEKSTVNLYGTRNDSFWPAPETPPKFRPVFTGACEINQVRINNMQVL